MLGPRTQPKPRAASSAPGRVRQRSGPCGQPGTRERLAAQKASRVPFALAASSPRCASQAFGRHNAEDPLEYVGRWGKAHSEETPTPFHHRLLLGALRLAQAGCLTDEGGRVLDQHTAARRRRQGDPRAGRRPRAAPPRARRAHARQRHLHRASRRRTHRPALHRRAAQARTSDHRRRPRPDRGRSAAARAASQIMVLAEDGRWQQTAKLGRGGGASILIVFATG